MKTLQSNFITSEQSKRLLELGLPADSADCYISNEKIFVLHNCTFQENFNNDLDIARSHLIDMPHYIPCWSVGRLIEIHLKCCTTLNQNDAHIVISRFGIETGGLCQDMYHMVGECALRGNYDFSKLEE